MEIAPRHPVGACALATLLIKIREFSYHAWDAADSDQDHRLRFFHRLALVVYRAGAISRSR
jgi:hypothetical protein